MKLIDQSKGCQEPLVTNTSHVALGDPVDSIIGGE